MPRNGSNIYYIPPGTDGFPDTTIESEKYNNYIHDVETDLNTPRPISAGGTGANSADAALLSLHAEKAGQEVTNFDTHVWMAGSFYSTISATAPPVALHAFSGIAHITDANNMVVEAVDLTDPLHKSFIRVKTAGVWGAWEGVSIVTCSDTPPTGNRASDNALWWESDTGLLYIRYNDGDSSQWTIACPQPDISSYAFKTDVEGKVAKSGDTMEGPLVLYASPPTADLEAVNKKYVDDISSNIASGGNVVLNGDFRINQGSYVSAAVLAAGAYGHDQWKAGAGGGDYSFTQLKVSTQITIAAGKTLIQPIEDVNVAGGSYVLSWTGTAQARAGVNTLTPSGSYADSPLLITGQTAGTVMSVEFNNGTLGFVKLESGSTATPFIMRPYHQELLECKRYFYSGVPELRGVLIPGISARFGTPHPVTMRAAPQLTITAPLPCFDGGTTGTVGTIIANYCTPDILEFDGGIVSGGMVAGKVALSYQGAGGNIKVDARL